MGLARIIPAVAVVAALAVPATAHAGPATTASAAAKHRYVAVTHRRALHWHDVVPSPYDERVVAVPVRGLERRDPRYLHHPRPRWGGADH
jgi:hypothetical protein